MKLSRFLIVLFLSMNLLLYAQRDWSKMAVETTELSAGLYRLFVGESVAVIAFDGPDGLLLIDAAYEQTTTQLTKALAAISPNPVRYLVNTHLHADHTGGNLELGKGAMIIAHHSVREWLLSDRRRGDNAPGPYPEHAVPGLTFESELDLKFNGTNLRMRHMPPSHTRGDITIYFEDAGVLVLGDLLFAGFFPFVDVSQGGNPFGLIQNLHQIIGQYPDETIFVGGHGPVFNKKELVDYLAELEGSIAAIAKAKAAGMDAEKMKESRILSHWEAFGSFFITEERWIDIVFPFVD